MMIFFHFITEVVSGQSPWDLPLAERDFQAGIGSVLYELINNLGKVEACKYFHFYFLTYIL
jgi:hypothetical protein